MFLIRWIAIPNTMLLHISRKVTNLSKTF